MKILQIQDGISVNMDEIDAIEKVDEFSCKVYLGTHVYLSTFSYDTLIQIIRNHGLLSDGDKLTQVNEKLGKLVENSQVWNG